MKSCNTELANLLANPHTAGAYQAETQSADNDRLVLEQECKHISGLSRQRRWELERIGKFPKRVKLGERTNAWRLSELLQWIDDIAAARSV